MAENLLGSLEASLLHDDVPERQQAQDPRPCVAVSARLTAVTAHGTAKKLLRAIEIAASLGQLIRQHPSSMSRQIGISAGNGYPGRLFRLVLGRIQQAEAEELLRSVLPSVDLSRGVS